MKPDTDVTDRLERAADTVGIDTRRRLDATHGAAERRGRRRRIQALAVAAVVGLLAVMAAWQLRFSEDRAPLPATTAGPSGHLTFLSAGEGSTDLFQIDALTGRRSSVVDLEDSVIWGAWSPDGARIASIVEGPGPSRRVVVTAADGSDPLTVVETDDTGAVGPDLLNLSWSPDGRRIAYSGRTVERGVARRTVIIVKSDGSGSPTVLDGLWVWVSWSPDGRRLLMAGFPDVGTDTPRFDLFTARPDGTGLMQLTDDEAEEHSPAWSPDGRRIVFSEGTDDRQNLYVMDADGSNVRRLTEGAGFDVLPVWAPDGAWIAFASDRGGDPAAGATIYIMRSDGSQVRRLVRTSVDASYPTSWTS